MSDTPTRPVRIKGTVYLSGGVRGFPPGTELPLPEAVAADLVASGHAEALPEPDAPPAA